MRVFLTIVLLTTKILAQVHAQSFFVERATNFNLDHHYQTSEVVWGAGVTFFDFTGDGLDDLSFTSGSGDSLQFYESTGASFIDKGGLGIAEVAESKQIIWVDYDNDGDKDLFVTNLLSQSRLWQNIGNLEFQDVTEHVGILINSMPTYGAVWGDYDRDGYLDLYITNYTSPDYAFDLPGPKRNYLYHNLCDGTFEEVAVNQGVELQDFHYFSAAFLDFNNNNWPELFVVQDLGANLSQTANVLFWNNKGVYVNAQNTGDLEDVRMNAMCISSSDYDLDGDLDVFIANTAGKKSKFHVNNGDSSFTESASFAGLEFNDEGASWGAQFFDFDNDGWEDIGITGAKPVVFYPRQLDKLYKNSKNGTFSPLSSSEIDFTDSARSFSIAYGDYNADGLLDFGIATADIDSVKFYENVMDNSNHYIYLNLEGTASNRDGIGAWVRCYTDSVRQVRYTTCGIGFLSQNMHNVHFGIDSKTVIDSLQVQWPSGWSDWYYNVTADQVLDITEGETADFRFNLSSVDTVYKCNVDNLTLYAPDYLSYQWNNDSESDSLIVSNSGIYACSVIASNGERGFSYPVMVKSKADLCLLGGIESELREPVYVIPNPSSGLFHILDMNIISYKVTDIAGKVILSGNRKVIDLTPYPNGAYILYLSTREEGFITRVVKH